MLIVFIGLAVTMTIWGALQIDALENVVKTQRIKRLSEVAETIHTYYQHFPTRKGISALDHSLNTLIQVDERLARIDIFIVEKKDVNIITGAGRIYYDWQENNIIKVTQQKEPFYAEVTTDRGQVTGVLFPFTNNDVTIVVSVMSFVQAQEEIITSSLHFLIISSLIFIVVMMLLLMLGYRNIVEKPLSVIIKTIDESQLGERVQQIPLDRRDEWGYLSQRFNLMAEKIRFVMKRNEELTIGLQERVNEGTHRILFLQNQLSELQRLSTLGHFVATLAHDMGTPLHSIAGMAQLLLEKPDVSPANRRKVELILQQTQHLISLIRDVRHATRQPEPCFSATIVDELLEETRMLFEATTLNRNIRIDVVVEAGLPEIYIDRHRIQTAIFNILQNAIEAIKNTGNILISAKRDIYRRTLNISIKDDGPGISSDFINKIQEPFFSTHQDDGIRGLGLLIVNEIMALHSGSCNIKSENGQGTEATLFFPIVDKT